MPFQKNTPFLFEKLLTFFPVKACSITHIHTLYYFPQQAREWKIENLAAASPCKRFFHSTESFFSLNGNSQKIIFFTFIIFFPAQTEFLTKTWGEGELRERITAFYDVSFFPCCHSFVGDNDLKLRESLFVRLTFEGLDAIIIMHLLVAGFWRMGR